MVLHQDLAVLRSCLLVLSLFSCSAVFFSIMPSCVWSTLGARAPQWEGGWRRWDDRPPQCRGSRRWCAGVGRPPILPPFPFENVSRWCWPECRLSPCFWSLDYLPLEYCLMMTVNVMASNRHLRWWSPPIWFVGEQTVGRVIVCPWSGEEVVALPSVSDVCRHRSESTSYCGRRRTSKTVVHQRLGLRSIGVTRPSSNLLLGVTWLWQSGTCPPRGACVKWRVEYDNEDGLRWWRGRERLSSGGLRHLPVSDWQMDDTSELLCVRWRLTSECGHVSVAG